MFLMEKNEAILLFYSNSCKQDSKIVKLRICSKLHMFIPTIKEMNASFSCFYTFVFLSFVRQKSFVRQVWDKGIKLLT